MSAEFINLHLLWGGAEAKEEEREAAHVPALSANRAEGKTHKQHYDIYCCISSTQWEYSNGLCWETLALPQLPWACSEGSTWLTSNFNTTIPAPACTDHILYLTFNAASQS